jgi:hypothetical protein
MNQESSGMAKGFACIKCGTGTLVKSNMKMTPDGKPYCRNEVGCAARVAKQWSKPLDQPLFKTVEDRMLFNTSRWLNEEEEKDAKKFFTGL